MKDFFADLHVHIGWTEKGKPVKISASKKLTFHRILQESFFRKGLDLIGIIDAHSPLVQMEIIEYLKQGVITELAGGGLAYKGLTILLGSEIEIKEEKRGAAHFLVFLPSLNDMISFSGWLQKHMKNITLSSQRLYVSAKELQYEVKKREGLFIPAHIFTPFKSIYGNCCNRMEEILDLNLIDAVELGLSSNTDMADRIEELHKFTFLTNSDAHSLPKIGREYNQLFMQDADFHEFKLALHHLQNRKVSANYGLDPKLGKYHKSRCLNCQHSIDNDEGFCKNCGSTKIVKGVSNRIDEIATYVRNHHPKNRPVYVNQVPLEFIPKLGPKTLNKLLNHFGTEMNILHRVSESELLNVIPLDITQMIVRARNGKLKVAKGGGGIYGKILK